MRLAISSSWTTSSSARGSFPSNYYIDKQGKLRGPDVDLSSGWGMRWRLGCAAEVVPDRPL